MVVLSLLIALAPGLFLIWYFNHRDKYEPEPKKKIVIIFAIGALMVVPAAIGERLLANLFGTFSTGIVYTAMLSFLIIAPIEELLKFVAVRKWIYRSVEFDEVMDGIVYTVSASLGFATFENVLYVFSLGPVAGIVRAFLAVPGHALFGAIMGYYIGLAKFNPEKESRLIARGVLYAILCHGLYDFLALLQNSFSSFVILLLVVLSLWIRIKLKKAEAASRKRFGSGAETRRTAADEIASSSPTKPDSSQ
ncbi:MAG: PrsW family intramembrane metalloprotease [candidate division WOR-3 bacterium]|nr:MAG: PrsW family intramembrane metalloprotease [candidate division WOR-3 bacterium]